MLSQKWIDIILFFSMSFSRTHTIHNIRPIYGIIIVIVRVVLATSLSVRLFLKTKASTLHSDINKLDKYYFYNNDFYLSLGYILVKTLRVASNIN